MIETRARGLANLHVAVTAACLGGFYWAYAAVIVHVPFVHLGHEVNLTPYFLCALGGMLLTARDARRLTGRFHLPDLGGSARLAFRQVVTMALLTFTMMFATQDHHISRLFLGSFLALCWPLLSVLNARVPRMLAGAVFGKGRRLPTVFVGRAETFSRLSAWIAGKEVLGMDPIGLLCPGPRPPGDAALPVPLLGEPGDLPRVLAESRAGQVVLLELPASDEEARFVIEACRASGCRLLIHSDIDERYTEPLVPVAEEGRHYYTLQEEPLEDPLNRVLKRCFDLAIAVPVVVVLLPPLCAWVAIVQRIQAPGPLFHARERRGLKGQVFRMLKFRSMYASGEENPAAESRQATAEDGRVFPAGRFLRRRSIDEIPQFWNVLKGEMSVAGPRPYMPLLDERFRAGTHGYLTRHLVKPGVTGLAQSLGYRGVVLNEEMLHRRVYWDVYYISHWSVWLDLVITVRTLLQVLRPPGGAC